MDSDQVHRRQNLDFSSRFLKFVFFLLIWGLLPCFAVQAATPVTDAQFQAVRERFGEKHHGIPGMNAGQIDAVVSETGARIELNTAGKRNSDRSDLDIFAYPDDLELYDAASRQVPPDKIHACLIQKFEEKWSHRMTGTSPG